MCFSLKVKYTFIVGDPIEGPKREIVRHCREQQIDLAVLGSRGMGALQRSFFSLLFLFSLIHFLLSYLSHCFSISLFLLLLFSAMVGSVVDYVVHHIPCDVLVVKRGEREIEAESA